MSEFNIECPRKRQRVYSNSSVETFDAPDEKDRQPPRKKRITTETSEKEVDKENQSSVAKHGTSQGRKPYALPLQSMSQDDHNIVLEPSCITETDRLIHEAEDSASLPPIHAAGLVPEYLLNKKYETKPPPYIPHRGYIGDAAESLPARKRQYESTTSYPDSEDDRYTIHAPIPQRAGAVAPLYWLKLDRSLASAFQAPYANSGGSTENSNGTNTPSKDQRPGPTKSTTKSRTSTVVSGRRMITLSKHASRLQKLFAGYPKPNDPFPEGFTLTELCTHYPNHLFGENLYPFLQHKWSSSKIVGLLPDQNGVAEDDRVTANAIASRMRKVKVALEKSGDYDAVLNGPKTHSELSLHSDEEERNSEDDLSEKEMRPEKAVKVRKSKRTMPNHENANQTIRITRTRGGQAGLMDSISTDAGESWVESASADGFVSKSTDQDSERDTDNENFDD